MSGLAVVIGASLVGLAVWLSLDRRLLGWLRALVRRWRAAGELWRNADVHPSAERVIDAAARLLGPLHSRFRRRWAEYARAARRARCMDELPELIDVVALGMSAGVSFDAALAIYCGRYRTWFAEALGEAMQSWRLGMASRCDALRGLSGSLRLGAFTTFCETVTESLDFGVPLAKTLSGQAETVRRARREAVEEQIEKLLTRQDEAERVLAVAFARLLRLSAALARARRAGCGCGT